MILFVLLQFMGICLYTIDINSVFKVDDIKFVLPFQLPSVEIEVVKLD